MRLNNNKFVTKKVQHFSIRKLSIGAASVLVGAVLYLGGVNSCVYAAKPTPSESSELNVTQPKNTQKVSDEKLQAKLVQSSGRPNSTRQSQNLPSVQQPTRVPRVATRNSSEQESIKVYAYDAVIPTTGSSSSADAWMNQDASWMDDYKNIPLQKINNQYKDVDLGIVINKLNHKYPNFTFHFYDEDNNMLKLDQPLNPNKIKGRTLFLEVEAKGAITPSKEINRTQGELNKAENAINIDNPNQTVSFKFKREDAQATITNGAYLSPEKVYRITSTSTNHNDSDAMLTLPESDWAENIYTISYPDNEGKIVKKYVLMNPIKTYTNWAQTYNVLRNSTEDLSLKKEYEKDLFKKNISCKSEAEADNLLHSLFPQGEFLSNSNKEDVIEEGKRLFQYNTPNSISCSVDSGLGILVPEYNNDGKIIKEKNKNKYAGIIFAYNPDSSGLDNSKINLRYKALDPNYKGELKPVYLYLSSDSGEGMSGFLKINLTRNPKPAGPSFVPTSHEHLQNAKLNIVDEETGQSITDPMPASGNSNTPILFASGAQTIADLLAQGYKFDYAYNDTEMSRMVGDKYGDLNFGNYDDNDNTTQTFTIYLIKNMPSQPNQPITSDKPGQPTNSDKPNEKIPESKIQEKQSCETPVKVVVNLVKNQHKVGIRNKLQNESKIDKESTLPQTGENKDANILARIVGLLTIAALGIGIKIPKRRNN